MKRIKFTEEMVKDACDKRLEELAKSTEKIKEQFQQIVGKDCFSSIPKGFDKYLDVDHDKANIVFTPEAYVKMVLLLRHFESEVAWHGVVKKESASRYIITDILVYPQKVSGATVNTDQEDYQKWLISMDDEVFNSIHMQGHSHVRMSTGPSAVDLTHQEQIVRQIGESDYYIFMIFNKELQHHVFLYDGSQNIAFEDADIVLSVEGETFTDTAFIENADKLVKRTVYTPASYKSGGVANLPYREGGLKGVSTAEKKRNVNVAESEDEDEDEEFGSGTALFGSDEMDGYRGYGNSGVYGGVDYSRVYGRGRW